MFGDNAREKPSYPFYRRACTPAVRHVAPIIACLSLLTGHDSAASGIEKSCWQLPELTDSSREYCLIVEPKAVLVGQEITFTATVNPPRDRIKYRFRFDKEQKAATINPSISRVFDQPYSSLVSVAFYVDDKLIIESGPIRFYADPPGTGTTPPPGTTATQPPITGTTPPRGIGTTQAPGAGTTPPRGIGAAQTPGAGSTPPSGTTTMQPPITGTTPPRGIGTTQTPGAGTTPPSGTTTTQPPITRTTPPRGTGTTQTPGAGTTPPSGTTTTQPPITGTTPPRGIGTTQTPGAGTTPPSGTTTTQPPITGTTPPRSIGTTQAPGTGTAPPSGTATTQPPITGTTPPRSIGTTQAPGTGTAAPSGTATTQPPITGTPPPQGIGTTQAPGTGTAPPSGTATTQPPITGTTPPRGSGTTQAPGNGTTQPSGTDDTLHAGADPDDPSDAPKKTAPFEWLLILLLAVFLLILVVPLYRLWTVWDYLHRMLRFRDRRAWSKMYLLIREMPASLAKRAIVRQQHAFALNRDGRGEEAERILRNLRNEQGPTAETNGILGRVYKDRWETALADGQTEAAAGLLDLAVETYVEGHNASPDNPYPGVNAQTLAQFYDPLPNWYDKLAQQVSKSAQTFRDIHDPYWVHATCLEIAVLERDENSARTALSRAIDAKPIPWQIETTLNNLRLIREARLERNELPPGWADEIELKLTAAMDELAAIRVRSRRLTALFRSLRKRT